MLFLKYVAPFLASDCGYLSLRRVREPDRSLLERMEGNDRDARRGRSEGTGARACLKNVNMPNRRSFCPLDSTIFP